MGEHTGPDRRKYKRISKHFILTYYDLAYPEKRHEATQLRNISLGGMSLITGVPFKPKTVLGIELRTPFVSELVHLEGLVLESHERVKNIIYETRMTFTNLSPQAEYVLNKIIEHFDKYEGSQHE